MAREVQCNFLQSIFAALMGEEICQTAKKHGCRRMSSPHSGCWNVPGLSPAEDLDFTFYYSENKFCRNAEKGQQTKT